MAIGVTCSRTTRVEGLVNEVESRLILSDKFTFESPHKSVVVLVDDLHLAQEGPLSYQPPAALQSLLTHKGWFSYTNKRYLNLKDTSFVVYGRSS